MRRKHTTSLFIGASIAIWACAGAIGGTAKTIPQTPAQYTVEITKNEKTIGHGVVVRKVDTQSGGFNYYVASANARIAAMCKEKEQCRVVTSNQKKYKNVIATKSQPQQFSVLIVSTNAVLHPASICPQQSPSSASQKRTTKAGTFLGNCLFALKDGKTVVPSQQLCAHDQNIRCNTNSSPRSNTSAQKTTSKRLKSNNFDAVGRVDITSNAGSGVIIHKVGDTYTVATNEHVIRRFREGTFTVKEKKYPIQKVEFPKCTPQNRISICDFDIAIFTITTVDKLPVAKLQRTVHRDAKVIAVGHRFGEKEVTEEPGEVKRVFNYPDDALWKGHTIGYTSNVVQGMSGGGIFDGKNLVGINANGKGSNRFNTKIILNGIVISKNIFKRIDGQPISDELKSEYNNYSWGISIDTICTVFPNACPKASTSDDQGL